MKEFLKKILACMIILLVFPFVLTLFLSGRAACPIVVRVDIEDYVTAVAAMEIPWDAQEETIKAQCVIARTNLYREMQERGKDTLSQAAAFLKEGKSREGFRQHFAVFEKSAAQTKGEILLWQSQVREIPFFRISAGKTRDGVEVLGEDFAYLPSVDTKKDLESEDFLKGFYFTKRELEDMLRKSRPEFTWVSDKNGKEKEMTEQIVVTKTDQAGYVMEAVVGSQIFQGEELRKCLELNSSCFTVQVLGEQIRFLCKGLGHGMGLSQYTADVMAKEGYSYTDMLAYFFPTMELTAIEKYEQTKN